MSGEIDFTRGYSFTGDEDPLTAAKLNQLGLPSGRIRPGSVTAAELDVPSVAGALESVAAVRNHFIDPMYAAPWLTPAGVTVSGTTGNVLNSPHWFAQTAAGSVTYAREASSPDGSNLYSAKLTGDASATGKVWFGQLIPAAIAGAMGDSLTVSVYIKNDTGAAMTPLLRLRGCSTVDDFGTLAEITAVATTEIGNTLWGRVSTTFDISATDFLNGGSIEVEIPALSLNNGSKSVQIAQAQAERGSSVTNFVVPEHVSEARYFSASTAPAVTNDWTEGYRRGDRWLNTATGAEYVCRLPDPAGAATWTRVTPNPPIVILQHRKAQNTTGGTSAATTWTRSEFSHKVSDDQAICTLSFSEFTLPAGTYDIEAMVPFYKVGQAQIRLYNVTDGAIQNNRVALPIYGSAAFADPSIGNMAWSTIRDQFTIAATKTLKIDYYATAPPTAYGLGLPANCGTEVYGQLKLVKLAVY